MKKQCFSPLMLAPLLCSAGISANVLAAVPVLSVVTKVPTPAADITPDFTFKSTVAGSIIYGGDCSSAKTSAIAGNNKITFNLLKTGNHYNCTVRVKNTEGVTSAALAVPGFSISYSPEARLTLVTKEDNNVDGVVDYTDTSTYDVNGRLIKDTRQQGIDGPIRISELNVYDSYGNITSAKIDDNEDGVYEDVSKFENSYDSMGNLIKRKASVIVKGVSYPAGQRSYTYNSKYNITAENVSGEGDGSYSIVYAYNTMGKLASKKTDFNKDGLNDRTVSYTYDDKGRLTKRNTSILYNALTYALNFSYNTTNRITKVRIDSNSSKIPETVFSISYTSNLPTSYKLDNDGDGAVDETGTLAATGSADVNNIISSMFEDI